MTGIDHRNEAGELTALFILPHEIHYDKPKTVNELKYVLITATLASELNQRWHSRLPRIHWSNIVRAKNSLCFGVLHNNVYIGTSIWSSPVARKYDDYQTLELRRMALSDMCPSNTATHFLSFMIRHIKKSLPEITLLISYQDTEVHKGTIYKAGNWKLAGNTRFVSWSSSRKRNADQSDADKLRWEYRLKEHKYYAKRLKNKQLDILQSEG